VTALVPIVAVIVFLALYPQFVLERSEDSVVPGRGRGLAVTRSAPRRSTTAASRR
jgi:hypothetical protein